ncbi:LAFE_0H10968g1_1 [Lachancea fermentati]|uniref:LAFE_0H10968g1_1 n=1 Tax=Lachancea fermentati TaxID=4955 RepID=A0A1G4MKG3_LACFM|nr:LAFE_0H10968g1_1 [Lachancea fermentati]
MDDRKLQIGTLYALSHEYSDHAHKIAGSVSTEDEMRQYYTLISMSIKALQAIKEQFQLTAEQDVVVTVELSDLLIKETHNLDLAEMYLSSVRERLRETTLFHEKMLIEFFLFRVAKARDDSRYTREAIRNLTNLLEMLETTNSPWSDVFRFTYIQFCEREEKPGHVAAKYLEVLERTKVHKALHSFLLCRYVCFCLENWIEIRDDLLTELLAIENSEDLPIQLILWKQFVELLVLIFKDENITSKLSDFKTILSSHKKELLASHFELSVSPEIIITVESPILQYADVKNILLFLQSVSYLTNCYDKRTNFSTKFIPKVKKTTNELIKAPHSSSLSDQGSRCSFYERLLELCAFYESLEGLILHANCEEQSIPNKYKPLVDGMKYQLELDSQKALAKFSEISNFEKDPELELITLCNVFNIHLGTISAAGQNVSLDQYKIANDTWDRIQKIYQGYGFDQNHIWRCTITILWITSHFEPFTNVQLAKTDNEPYMDQLKWYYLGNRLSGGGSGDGNNEESNTVIDKSPPLKKSLLLHFLLNYLAGSMVVHDLQEKCQVSNTCFHMGKQQAMPLMRYLAGIWNLINCSLAMKGKDVAVTKAKLSSLVQKLLESGFTET